jgi:hypothetical protein
VLVFVLVVADLLVLFGLGVGVDVVGVSAFCGVAGLLSVGGSKTSFCEVVKGRAVSACLDFTANCHMPNPPPITTTIAKITSGFLIKKSIFATQPVRSNSGPPDTIPVDDDSKGCLGWLGSIFYSF